MKWFLLFGGIALAYFWFKGKKKAAVAATQASKSQSLRPKVSNPEVMVRCQCCAVHLPQSEAIAKDDRFYCSRKTYPYFGCNGLAWVCNLAYFT
ncbi:PP0621 family protein [Polynucleobacter antarcticus]|uniref:PP0621 family protein n=1 Tax=Polynucleobacter antarcticus TaxID=1743162 RepID=UPI00266E971E|nr:PP0621 family protein [Polynucleobacter antarcticus]